MKEQTKEFKPYFKNDNDECDEMIARLLSKKQIRESYIKTALASGDSPELIKKILNGLGVYS